MNIQWHTVTWYSKLIAVILFVATFYIGFSLGIQKAQVDAPYVYTPSNTGEVATTPKPVASTPVNTKQCFKSSQDSDAEEYIYQNNTLGKLSYRQVVSQDVLIPDKSRSPTIIPYTKEACPN